ncbi:MAG: hypothetical protein H0T46_29880 [Deltaproteobacteria bacterium]|nr:hypothetical protein [Deltaproteobacteria bacterium]
MGSRRRRHAAIVALALGLSSACTSGPPPGFVGGTGEQWSIPLVGSLEHSLLLVPVTIDSKGPYLFAIDPDANITAVDEQIVKEGKFRTFQGPHLLDETDTQQIRFYAELSGIEMGSLIIERRNVMIVKRHTYDRQGRRIMGILGRDVLADSLVFGFDRDQALVHLLTVKAFKPPVGAIRIPFQLVGGRIPNIQVQPVPRRLVTATIGTESFAMHVDLGEYLSTLRESLWDKARLAAAAVRSGSIDEVGMPHKIEKVASGQPVAVGGITMDKVLFAPYEDKRWSETDVAGTLALDFFRDYNVWLHWDDKAIYLVKRTPVPLATRIARWDTGALEKCPNPGCVSVKLIDPMAGKELAPGAVHPGVVVSVTRDEPAGGMELEVTLEANGRPELPPLVVNMSPNGERVMEHLRGQWAGVTFTVVDASPFPRECRSATGCIDQIAR